MKMTAMLSMGLALGVAARADFKLGEITLPDDCAALRAPAAPAPELEKQNGWRELQAVAAGFPRREYNAKSPDDFMSLHSWASHHPENKMVTAKASMLLRRDAAGLSAWDRFLNAPVIVEPPGPTSYAELVGPAESPGWPRVNFRACREATLASAWRVRVLQAQGKPTEARAEWIRVRAGLERARVGASTLVWTMMLHVFSGVLDQSVWELTPTRAEVAAPDTRGESFSPDNWRRTVLAEMRIGVACLPTTDAEIAHDIRGMNSVPLTHAQSSWSVAEDLWPKSVADYRAKVMPIHGTPVERAREAVHRLEKLGAPGLEFVSEFKRRLSVPDPWSRRIEQLARVGIGLHATRVEEVAYCLEWARVIRCRQVRVVAALRAYAGEHGGAYPEKLSELVPVYLSALPKDPYSGADFCYDPKWPALWSVGPNGKDDGGVHSVGIQFEDSGDIVSRPFGSPTARPVSTLAPTPVEK